MINNSKYKEIKYNGEWKIDKDQGWNSEKNIFDGSFINKIKNNDTGDEEENIYSGQWKKNIPYTDNNTIFEGTFVGNITDNNTSKVNKLIKYTFKNKDIINNINTTNIYKYTGKWYGKWDNKNFNGNFIGKTENAFVLVHFGNKSNYLELEIFFLINLKKNTKNDIIYFYSINDTPPKFIKIIKKYCTHVIPYDDLNITFGNQDSLKLFPSGYILFNTLRTCNFIFAYKLIEYSKICIIESDMIIRENIDDIFNLNIPSILIFQPHDEANIFENYKLEKNKKNYEDFNINGGIMLIEPSMEKYKECLEKIKIIVNIKPTYPNEKLFLLINDYIYNLPFIYNVTRQTIKNIVKKYKIDLEKYSKIIHFNSTHKHLNFFRDDGGKYLEIEKKNNIILYNILSEYKKKYYDKYNEKIENIIKKIPKL